jgi:predicted site-specific integrase-resolvase
MADETLQLITPKEVQDYLRISSTGLYRLERDGLLKPIRLKAGMHQHRRYRKEDIELFIESRMER